MTQPPLPEDIDDDTTVDDIKRDTLSYSSEGIPIVWTGSKWVIAKQPIRLTGIAAVVAWLAAIGMVLSFLFTVINALDSNSRSMSSHTVYCLNNPGGYNC